jgi:hypothetical protein
MVFSRLYPFTAPAVIPDIIYFWQNKYKISSGATVRTMSAKIRFQEEP